MALHNANHSPKTRLHHRVTELVLVKNLTNLFFTCRKGKGHDQSFFFCKQKPELTCTIYKRLNFSILGSENS